MSIARVWAKHGVKPHRLECYMASNDADFESKATDIIELYRNPHQHAAVFSVEKTAIQGLDRKDPVLPLSPGRAERHGFEYFATVRSRCMLLSTPEPGSVGENRPAPY
jgi:predicted Zn-ribbon and HTH transcriptional regulator